MGKTVFVVIRKIRKSSFIMGIFGTKKGAIDSKENLLEQDPKAKINIEEFELNMQYIHTAIKSKK